MMQFLEKVFKMLKNIEIFNLYQQKYEEVSKPNYHTTKFFTENLLAIKIRKTQILMNQPVYLGLPILNLSKNAMHEFWYDYVKPKYGKNAKLWYIDTDVSIVHVKTDNIYKDITKDVEARFDTSDFELDRPLPKGKNWNWINET